MNQQLTTEGKMIASKSKTVSVVFLLAVSAAFVLSSSAAAQSGNWSSGDRNNELDTRPSKGWKKIGSAVAKGLPYPAYFFPPAIASTGAKTGVMWTVGKRIIAGRLWDKNTGLWNSQIDFSFYAPSLPNKIDFMSSPALVHRGGGLLDLVVLGFDQYYHTYYVDGKWSAWEPIGGMGHEPAISVNRSGPGPKKLDVWVIAKGSVWRKRWEQATGWQEWGEIGYPKGVFLTTAPGVTVREDNTIDIVAPAQADGQLWHASYSPANVFSGWESIPGKTFRQPSLTSNSADRLDVWVVGASDGRIYHEVWTNASGWSEFETSVNDSASGTYSLITSGPSVDVLLGVTTVAAINQSGEVLVRSFVKALAPKAAVMPASIQIRRPLKTPPSFVIEGRAENTIAIAPACNSVYLSLGWSGDVQKQKMTCVLDGTGQKTEGVFNACDSQSSTSAALGSTDNQMAVLKNGTVLYLRQGGGVKSATTRTGNGERCRGVENIFFASNCGSNWAGPITLDPCDPKGPFDASFCNSDAGAAPPCNDQSPKSGTDRPEILASRHDDSVFMAAGVAGAKGKYNLVLFRSSEKDLTSWKVMDTGLGSGGALSLSESPTHLYMSRCEYGTDPFNVGLYAYRKDQPFTANNFSFLGNIADASCSRGDVNISMMKTINGVAVVRWVIPYGIGVHQFYRRGFSMLTPGGPATLQKVDYASISQAKLPTLVANDYDDRALLYWYELGKNDNRWRVMASVSDGLGRWSTPFALSGSAFWMPGLLEPWKTWPVGHDYMKGYVVKFGEKRKFLTQWIQPVGTKPSDTNNEIFYGIVDY